MAGRAGGAEAWPAGPEGTAWLAGPEGAARRARWRGPGAGAGGHADDPRRFPRYRPAAVDIGGIDVRVGAHRRGCRPGVHRRPRRPGPRRRSWARIRPRS